MTVRPSTRGSASPGGRTCGFLRPDEAELLLPPTLLGRGEGFRIWDFRTTGAFGCSGFGFFGV